MNHVPYIGRQILKPWATKEVPFLSFLKKIFAEHRILVSQLEKNIRPLFMPPWFLMRILCLLKCFFLIYNIVSLLSRVFISF